MRRGTLAQVSAAVLTLFATVLPPASWATSPDLHWMTDFEAARAVSRESGKPLFVVFRCER